MKVYTTESTPADAPEPVEVVEHAAEHVEAVAEIHEHVVADSASDEDAPLTDKGVGQFFDIVEEI